MRHFCANNRLCETPAALPGLGTAYVYRCLQSSRHIESVSCHNRVKLLTRLTRFVIIWLMNKIKGGDRMVFRESETVELKEAVTDEIKKEIIAFANCDGGRLYIGVRCV